ncbi:YqaJ viral recombinase family protein, partial [Desulfamplus magnetovallimortis]|uniref:YqaJ viral recombinase family nuclease n=1 Tax=Desulfamplus magnetovallimortis TaxID=1246637 RepID=UPI001648D2E0
MKQVVDIRTISYEEWLQYRRSGIGGSDAGAIAGVNPYSSIASVYFDKVGEINSSPDMQEASEAIYWGKRLEDIIADEFAKRTGLQIEKSHYILRSEENPFMLANLDRIITGKEEGLECKTTSSFKKCDWDEECIPEMYMAQVQHYMAVTGFEGWWVAVLIGGNHFRYQYIERDDEYID